MNKSLIVKPEEILVSNIKSLSLILSFDYDKNNEKDIFILDNYCPRASIEIYCVFNQRNDHFRKFIRFLNTTSDNEITHCPSDKKSIIEKLYEYRQKYSNTKLLADFTKVSEIQKVNLLNENDHNLSEIISIMDYGCCLSTTDIIEYFIKISDIQTLLEMSSTHDLFLDVINKLSSNSLNYEKRYISKVFKKMNIRRLIHKQLHSYAKSTIHTCDYMDMFTACEVLHRYFCYVSNKHVIEHLISFFSFINPNYLTYIPKESKHTPIKICTELETNAKRVIEILKNRRNFNSDNTANIGSITTYNNSEYMINSCNSNSNSRFLDLLSNFNIMKNMNICPNNNCTVCSSTNSNIIKYAMNNYKANSNKILCDLMFDDVLVDKYHIDKFLNNKVEISLGDSGMNCKTISLSDKKSNKCRCINDERCNKCDYITNKKLTLNMSDKIVACCGINNRGEKCKNSFIIETSTPSCIINGKESKFCSSTCLMRTKNYESESITDDEHYGEDDDEDSSE
jgi:hypothetical protein